MQWIPLLAALLAVPTSLDSTTVTLRYAPRAGQSYRYDTRQEMSWESVIGGSKQSSRVDVRSVRIWKVDRVDASGDVQLALTIQRLQIETVLPNGTKTIMDSEKDADHPLSKTVGQPVVQITMSPMGQIERIEQLQRNGTEQLSTHLRTLVVPLSADPVRVGAEWQNRFDLVLPPPVGNGEKFAARHVMRLEQLEGSRATLNVRTELVDAVTDSSSAARLAQFISSGRVQFDVARGVIVSQDLRIDRTVADFAGKESSVRISGYYREQLAESVATELPRR